MTGFTPGQAVCRVYYPSFGDPSFTADTVHKVYKNGNFTLASDKAQQYRMYGSSEGRATGQSWARTSTHVVPWTEELKQQIKETRARRKRRVLVHMIKNRVAAISQHEEDQALLDALAAVLAVKDLGEAIKETK